MKKMNRKGFTIVELVIVIAVIAILAGVLIPTFSGIVDKANDSKALQEVKNAYTVYLAANNGTALDDVYVDVDGTIITINDGKVAIHDGATAPNTYSEYEIKTVNNEKTLSAVNP